VALDEPRDALRDQPRAVRCPTRAIPVIPMLVVPPVFVSASSDGGATFGLPAQIPPRVRKVNLDQNWTVCDNHPTYPFLGNCYKRARCIAHGERRRSAQVADWSSATDARGGAFA